MKRKYFKILNFNYFEGQFDSERLESMKEYDGEYNYELNNKYFENAWFYSDSENLLIEFQIFFTKYPHFRYPEIYKDAQLIQDYYLNKYNTPFFYSLSNDELKKKYHPVLYLDKHLNLDDFESVILPNLKINLISEINIDKFDFKGYYLFYHWDFYEEVQISSFSNSFLRFIETLPYGSKHVYDSEKKAKTGGLNALLENSSSTVDTTLKGLYFDFGNINSRIFSKDTYLYKSKVIPLIRSLNEIELIENEIDIAINYIISNSIKPFEIIKNN